MIASGSFGNNSLPQLMSVGSVGQHDDTRPLHRITNREQATQMVYCVPRTG